MNRSRDTTMRGEYIPNVRENYSSRGPYILHSFDLLAAWSMVFPRITGQLADTPTRSLPTRGLDKSRTRQLAVTQMPPKERKLITQSRRWHPRVDRSARCPVRESSSPRVGNPRVGVSASCPVTFPSIPYGYLAPPLCQLSRRCSGESCGQFGAERRRTQRYNHVADGLLRFHRLLVPEPDDLLSQLRRLPGRLRRLVLPLHFTSYHPSLPIVQGYQSS